jgi:hypothetical protein
LNCRRRPPVAFAPLQGPSRTGPCRSLTRPTVPLLGFRSLQRLRQNGSGSPGLSSPGTFRLRSFYSPGVLLPIPPPTHFSEWSALGILPSGLCTSRSATSPFGDACLPGVSRGRRHRPRSDTDGTVSRRGPWFPRVLTARSPSRLRSKREPASTTGRSSPAMGRSPLGFHPPWGLSPPPTQRGQMPHPPPSSFPPARSLAGPCRRRSTAFRLSAEVAFSLSRVPALPRFLPLAASPIWNVRSRWVIDSPKPRGSVSLPLPGFFCETVAPTGARRGCL